MALQLPCGAQRISLTYPTIGYFSIGKWRVSSLGASTTDMFRTVTCSALALSSIALAFVSTVAAAAPKNDALGQRMMLRCQTCHAVKSNAPSKVGPNLHKMFGRKAGTLAGYTFSPAMRKSGVIWNDATLDKFLEKPSAMMPGTLMAFGGMQKKEERAALIAWLKSNTK